MKTNVGFLTNLRRPLRSILFLVLFGLVSFGFVTKAVQFILVQRETGVLGNYYRSIGVLQNIADPKSGDISAGIELIQTSPYFAYGDQREIVSGVMSQIYNEKDRLPANTPDVFRSFPQEYWPNTHTFDSWFIAELIKKEEIKTLARQPENEKTVGYYLKFKVDTLLAAYPVNATKGSSVGLLFLFKENESAIPSIQAMEIGQRYIIRSWDIGYSGMDPSWQNTYGASLRIIPLDDADIWYIPITQGENIDLDDPILAPYKNAIEVLNENLHTLGILTTVDMSAIPRMQETSRFDYLTAGRWLNHQDDLDGNKAIVVPESFAQQAGLELGDEITFTFRPLTDTFFGFIRDGFDSLNWKTYLTYQDTFQIVGLYTGTKYPAYFAYIPSNCIQPGFISTSRPQFRDEQDYSFVLTTSRNETEFLQSYKEPLQELGISLNFLPNNGPAYWAAVDPIRQSLAADLLVFSLLMVSALVLVVILYVIQGRQNFAILRALGLPKKQVNRQTIFPLLLLGEIGVIIGGYASWQYAINQAKESLSSLPLPSGVTPSADLSPMILAGLCASIFLLLIIFTWLAVFFLSRKPVFELLQGETSRPSMKRKRSDKNNKNQSTHIPMQNLNHSTGVTGDTIQKDMDNKVENAHRGNYTPSSLGRYVLHHLFRSWHKSFLILVIAMGFALAAGWIRQTMNQSQKNADQLYDTTVVEADILPGEYSVNSISSTRSGFVYLKTVESVLNSGFIKSSVLEADTVWFNIKTLDFQQEYPGTYPVYAINEPNVFYSSLSIPSSLTFEQGWDLNLFNAPLTNEEIRMNGVPAIFPTNLLKVLQMKVGDTVRISDQTGHTYISTIIGQYAGRLMTTDNSTNIYRRITGEFEYIFIPFSALEFMDGSQTLFTVAHFVLDPAKNRELDDLRIAMEEPINVYGSKLRFIIWDEELRLVITQLEKNLSLLKVLYPVVIAVSVLIGAGLSFLLLLQSAKDAAILRILGTTKTAVRSALIVEPFFLSIIGSLLGLGIAILLWMRSDAVSIEPLLFSVALYLAGVLVGSVIGAISVTNKKPIELLQVKE